jgi:formate/nitrite transporter
MQAEHEGVRLDALLPPEMAQRAEDIGAKKAGLGLLPMFALAVLAGAFIGLGAAFATTVAAGSMPVRGADGAALATAALPYGVTRLLAGLSFTLGLILVVVAGAELFTGNNLIAMAWASRRVSTLAMLRNWVIVWIGNLVGAVGTAALVFLGGQYQFGGGAVGATALATAATKVDYDPLQAFVLGILCNALVCLAVWLTYSARSTSDRILAIISPIAAFVAMGFEHSVANMYFIPIGILIQQLAPAEFWTAIGTSAGAYATVDWAGFVGNIVPVTLGNIVGGSILVGAVYWVEYLRRARA